MTTLSALVAAVAVPFAARISEYATADLGCIIEVERFQSKVGGGDGKIATLYVFLDSMPSNRPQA